MMDRVEEVNSMDLQSFLVLFRNMHEARSFAHLFNWGVESLSEDEKNALKDVAKRSGVKAPITDSDLEIVCGAVSSRCVTLR